jgi:hypothetical protein
VTYRNGNPPDIGLDMIGFRRVAAKLEAGEAPPGQDALILGHSTINGRVSGLLPESVTCYITPGDQNLR